MIKTIFLIPGFKTQIADAQYQWLVSYLQSKKYVVKPVSITWNYKTVTQNAEEFLHFYDNNKSTQNYILGFSYGAVIALMTENITNPKEIILCSLSPDFKEDTKNMPKWLQSYIGNKRYADTKTRSAHKLAKSIETNLVAMYGEKEGNDYPLLKKRSEETANLATSSELIIVKNAPHDISFPSYQTAIKQVV
jgi:esterase/lipase